MGNSKEITKGKASRPVNFYTGLIIEGRFSLIPAERFEKEKKEEGKISKYTGENGNKRLQFSRK